MMQVKFGVGRQGCLVFKEDQSFVLFEFKSVKFSEEMNRIFVYADQLLEIECLCVSHVLSLSQYFVTMRDV